MFTYISPDIRTRLVEQGKLFRIDGAGSLIDAASNVSAHDGLTLDVLGPIPLPIQLGDQELQFQWYAIARCSELAKLAELADTLRARDGQHLFASLASSIAVNSVLVHGDPFHSERPLVRVHSSCVTGDVFGSQRCECGPQFLSAVSQIASDAAGGMLIYMSGHEGRGIGLWAKAVTYLLQDAGENTYQANQSLGLPEDCRDFSDAAAILLHFLGDRPLRLLTNNPKKIADLTEYGLTQVEAQRHVVGVGEWNRRYLAAKRDWGHLLSETDLGKANR